MMHWKHLKCQEKIEAIKVIWEAGMSARHIAANFDGATRFAVIGLYGRHGDKLKDHPLRLPCNQLGAARVRKEKTVSIRHPTAPQPPRRPPAYVGGPILAGKPLMMVGAKECRWPVNDAEVGEVHLFCAMPADGIYCSHHRLRGTTAPREAR